MISLFRTEAALEIATGHAPQPARPAYPDGLDKLELQDLIRASQPASSAASMTITPASGASAAAPTLPPAPELSRDDLEDRYQAYLRKWEVYKGWLKRDSEAYNIMRRHTEDSCRTVLGKGTSFEAWTALANVYKVLTFAPVIEAFEKITSQRSETAKSKAALTAAIQQSIVEFCELANVSPDLMNQLEPLILYQSLGPEYYHLKEQIKMMKQTDVNSQQIRSLINGHSVSTVKPPPAPSAAFASNKRKAGQEDQPSQTGRSNKRRKNNRGNKSGESKDPGTGTGTATAEVKKCNFCKKPGHLEQDCWSKDPSKRPLQRQSGQSNPAASDGS